MVKKIIFLDKTQELIDQNNYVGVWRKVSEKCKPNELIERKKKTEVSCMFWGVSLKLVLDRLYLNTVANIIDNHIWQVIVKESTQKSTWIEGNEKPK